MFGTIWATCFPNNTQYQNMGNFLENMDSGFDLGVRDVAIMPEERVGGVNKQMSIGNEPNAGTLYMFRWDWALLFQGWVLGILFLRRWIVRQFNYTT